MDFTEHNKAGDFSISGYDAGEIEVAGQRYGQAILVKTSEVVALDAEHCQALTEEVLSQILQQRPQPELIVVGTGSKQQFLPAKLQAMIAKERIGLEMMATPAACRTFNILLSEDRKAWAILWPTVAEN